MSENIFFNPGDSIASDFDFENAYVAAQIYHHKAAKPVLIAQEKDGKPYFIFDEAEQRSPKNTLKLKNFRL